MNGRLSIKYRKMITISVPTYSYCKKFAIYRANSDNGYITISTRNSYGIFLLKIIQKNTIWTPNISLKNYNDELIFKLSEYYYTREGFFLSKQNIIFFNQAIKNEFENSLFDLITININRKIKTTIEEEILIFLKFYGIYEREITLDSLIKAYQRWRKRRNYMIIKV